MAATVRASACAAQPRAKATSAASSARRRPRASASGAASGAASRAKSEVAEVMRDLSAAVRGRAEREVLIATRVAEMTPVLAWG
jgi:hypothetical protein